MEIVIKITEDDYNNIEPFLNGEEIKGGFNLFKALEIIKNGTPLPKVHGRLIDADIYKAEVYKYIAENKNSDDLYLSGCGDGAYHALHIYDCIPTIIEADKEDSNG